MQNLRSDRGYVFHQFKKFEGKNAGEKKGNETEHCVVSFLSRLSLAGHCMRLPLSELIFL